MKAFKFDSPLEKKVQQIEKLMNDLGVSIEWTGRFEVLENGVPKGYLAESGSHDTVTQFPRFFEEQRIALFET